MPVECELCAEGWEEYPKGYALLSNLPMLIWIGLGTAACWFLYPLIAWIYLTVALIMLYIVLRRLVCVNCYYYGKWCSIGWGKLAALLFKQGDIERFADSPGLKVAPMTYGTLTLVPVVLLTISLIKDFAIHKLVIMILLLLISFYNGVLSRKKSCARCKMNTICPGSLAKKA